MSSAVCSASKGSGGIDYFKSREICKKEQEIDKKTQDAEKNNPDLLLANYNLFMVAATKANIPQDMAESMMSISIQE